MGVSSNCHDVSLSPPVTIMDSGHFFPKKNAQAQDRNYHRDDGLKNYYNNKYDSDFSSEDESENVDLYHERYQLMDLIVKLVLSCILDIFPQNDVKFDELYIFAKALLTRSRLSLKNYEKSVLVLQNYKLKYQCDNYCLKELILGAFILSSNNNDENYWSRITGLSTPNIIRIVTSLKGCDIVRLTELQQFNSKLNKMWFVCLFNVDVAVVFVFTSIMDQNYEARLLLELFNSSKNRNNNNNVSHTHSLGGDTSKTHNNNEDNNNTNNNNNNDDNANKRRKSTPDDLNFLKLANEVLQSAPIKDQVDPTIKTLLERVQYFSSPHGGLPLQYPLRQQQQHQQQQQQQQQSNLDPRRFSYHNDNDNAASNDSHNIDFPDLSLNMFDPNVRRHHSISTAAITSIDNFNGRLQAAQQVPQQQVPAQKPQQQKQQQESQQQAASVLPAPILAPVLPPIVPHEVEPMSRGNSITSKNSNSLLNDGSEKPFICNKCSLSFRRSSDLKRHEKTHLEVLPNVCKLCHKGFARKDALKRHISTLTCRRNRDRLLKTLNIPNEEGRKNDELDTILKENNIDLEEHHRGLVHIKNTSDTEQS
ncbi:hypothetical protein PACTADRAFT_17942 [Pachysolen tannophilus NRRL Y-2460]|uniref:C2H2-type domain-containing protein n=1 Tax=Pachysolen tannophilus NRRL Y-2460 TaxID=669874 RepID=A0A1E4TRB5_PACTA|nr:hypothetical protein PACTADRAFT_17942 [Pachysolen tannophilus NRRL Y-2460]